ncbi:aminotransferase class IV [Balneola vulgaris]|uniref:aminotransferase class IV n=1 Tax=Balneola vulgaris TaxID=287535 RepID=UPI0003684D56|nr:aminotransferase class IV [Balneola vulgaris]
MSKHDYILIDGEIHLKEGATQKVATSSSFEEVGCFETIRSYQGKFFLLEEHIDRLNKGMEYLGIESVVNVQSIRKYILTLLSHNALLAQDCVVKIQCTSSVDRSRHVVISTRDLPEKLPHWKLALVQTPVASKKNIETSLKLSSRAHYDRAAEEANKLGADDALMLNEEGFISETTIANLFWIKDHTLYTPSVQCDPLTGITRNFILQSCKSESLIEVEEGAYTLNELLSAESVFACNSVREIIPIQQIGDTLFDTGHPVLTQISSLYSTNKKKRLN